MLLSGKIAVVYGAGGNVGGEIARVFAAEGARVVLVGRTRESLDAVVAEVRTAGGAAESHVLDASDAAAVDAHLDVVLAEHGRLDVSVNATSLHGEKQGDPLREMDVEDFLLPASTALRSTFVTATAAARRMGDGGVIILMSTSAAALSGRDRGFHRIGGFGVACAAVENLTRTLAGEVGRDGVRVVCVRPDALPETWGEGVTEPGGPAHEPFTYMTAGTALGRMPTLRQVADTAAFAASDRAGAITGTTIEVTCGSQM